MGNNPAIKMIGISLLHAHPLYATAVSREARCNLRVQISTTGRYEPVVVRRHPTIARAFEILHGHQRVAALRGLGHARVACLVWEMTDAEAMAMLAWANRHSGKEKAAGRLALLRRLHGLLGGDVERMAQALPERLETLRKVFAPAESFGTTESTPIPQAVEILAGKRGQLG